MIFGMMLAGIGIGALQNAAGCRDPNLLLQSLQLAASFLINFSHRHFYSAGLFSAPAAISARARGRQSG